MTQILWVLITIQIALGGFDTVFHHEGTERLAWRPGQQRELRLHGVRNLLYSLMFAVLGSAQPGGLLARAFLALLVVELVITLWDFVEEDRTRKLPATERVTHTLLTLNYGAIIALLLPVLLGWMHDPVLLQRAYYGLWSWMCVPASAGTFLFGLRDLFAARRMASFDQADLASLAPDLPDRRSIVVTGGTGFIGSRLVKALVAAGHEVTVLTRKAVSAAHLPAPIRIVTSLDQIPPDTRVDAIVNLAGEPISNAPWSPRKRERIIASRVSVTDEVGRFIDRLTNRPSVLVNGSAIGWYGLWDQERLTEESGFRPCFSHDVCAAWEGAAREAAGGARLVILRIGLVLGREGGMLARMLAPFEFGLGGPFGSGRQMMSWIHIDDLVRLIVRAIADDQFDAVVNATAPQPVDNRAFARTLGCVLRRPAILPVPAAPLRFALGDFADELLLGGQAVLPAKAQRLGFKFGYPGIRSAFAEIAGRAPVDEGKEPCLTDIRPAIASVLH
jgi:uncharacterized protein (TIGR01777 family)